MRWSLLRGVVVVGIWAAARGAPATACTDLELPLDEALQAPDDFGELLTRDTTLFMLRGLLGSNDGTVVDSGKSWSVACESLTDELRSALRGTLAFDGTVEPRSLRDVFEGRYLNTVTVRSHDEWIKPSLGGFAGATDFRAWPSVVVPRSAVKQRTRHIFRRPQGLSPRISVSQTLDTETGDTSAAVLETEVAIERANRVDWDFYAYNGAGRLVDYSTFPAGQRPAPRICIGCHYDGGARAVGRFFPEVE